MFYRLIRKIRQLRIRYSSNPRPDSFPFISGDGFRSLAQHIYEKGHTLLDPKQVMEKDIIFVEGEFLVDFFEHVHPQIVSPYILISHNADVGIDSSYVRYIDNKILHWFAQNTLVVHEKITPIPIGLENAHWANAGWKGFFTTTYRTDRTKPRICAQFNVATHPARPDIFKKLSSFSLVDTPPRKSQPQNVATARQYMFVASPPGNGEDCHRTWEALLWGCVPIVHHSVCVDYFISLGVPIWAIDSWDELAQYSEYDLKQKYDVIRASSRTDAVYMEYWRSRILSYKK
jgi:hypothetical protein